MYIIIMDAIFIAGMQDRVSAWIPLNWFLWQATSGKPSVVNKLLVSVVLSSC
jgi:hypothetical protein